MKKIFFGLFLFIFVLAPFFASAQTAVTSDTIKQQLIQLLLQEIAQLQAQISAILAQNSQNTSAPAPTPTPTGPFTGTLDLSKNATYANQTILAPQNNLKLADFTLTNNTSEPVSLKNIEVDLLINSNPYIANLYVNNLYLSTGGSKTPILNLMLAKNNWPINLQLSVGQKIDLSIYADINAAIPKNSTVAASVLGSGATTISATQVSTNSGAVLAGQTITFGAGSLSVGQDSATPALKMYVANQRIIAGKFQIDTTADSYTIYQLKFVIPGLNFMPVISDAVLSDSTTQAVLGTTPIQSDYAGDNSYFVFNINTPIAANSTKHLTVYYDLGAVNNLETLNTNIAPALIYLNAADSSRTYVDGASANYNTIATSLHGGLTLPDAGITVNSIKVFESMPTFTSGQPSIDATANNSQANLYTFTVLADPNGGVSLKQLTFLITINDPNNSNPYFDYFQLFKGSTDYSSHVAIGNILKGNYIGLKNNNGGLELVSTNTIVLYFTTEETIPAGKSQTYTLKAQANRFVSTATKGADSVSTSMPADSAQIDGSNYLGAIFSNANDGLSQVRNNNSAVEYNLLWSDKVALGHSDSNSTSSNDWYNGYGIAGLPLPTQTVSAK